MALADLQRLLADALPQRDPAAALQHASGESEMLRHLPEDGLLLTSLVLVKLRMQQLLKSPDVLQMFEENPEHFARQFEQYHADCPMSDFFPEGEGARFADWRQRRQST